MSPQTDSGPKLWHSSVTQCVLRLSRTDPANSECKFCLFQLQSITLGKLVYSRIGCPRTPSEESQFVFYDLMFSG